MEDLDKQQIESPRLRLMRACEFFKGDNDAVARAIESSTGQDISVRSVQSWLIDPRRASHRKVPEWVISALEKYVANPENQQEHQRHIERFERQLLEPSGGFKWVDKVRKTHAVEFATNEIEEKERHRTKWHDLLGKIAGEAFHEDFWLEKRERRAISQDLAAIAIALHESKTFEEFRAKANESMKVNQSVSHFVNDARTALEQRTDEFSNDEGLLISEKK